jgi:glutathione S-transferase
MNEGFILHGSRHSIPTYRVALMLRLCGVGFTLRYISFQRGMHRTPEFRAFSRWGQVPVLEHQGRVLLQSPAILEYLADTLGQFRATGDDARQQIREWLFWDTDRLMPPLYSWYSIELGRSGLLPLSFDPVLVADFDRKGEAALAFLENHLADYRFLVGDTATIADICCYADIVFARLAKKDLTGSPNVVAWAERVEALPGFTAPFDLLPMQDAEITA